MRPSDRDLVSLGPFPAGANNVARETSVPRASVREAINIDFSDDGKARRREGYALLESLPNASSIIGAGVRGFILAGSELHAFEVMNGAVAALIPIYDGLRPGARLASVLIEPDLFVSDGDQNLRIAADNTITPWAVPQADPPTVASRQAGGALPAATYRVALTCRMASGEEGPASPLLTIELAGGEYPTLSLPAAPDGVARYSVYMTKPNGTELLFVGSVPSAATTIDLVSPRLGRPCPTEFMAPMPPAQFALYFRSRLWVANGPYLTASEPFQYSLCQPDFATMTFSEDITGLAACGEAGGSFFVGQRSKVYLVRGDSPNELALAEKYPAGMVAGTLAMVPGARLPLEQAPSEPVPVWLATNGVVCVGLPDGSVVPLSESRFAADVGEVGAGIFLQRKGENRYVATTAEPRDNVFAMRDEVSFEVIRNGIPKTI
jgi:hypothetical protein